jgi:DNA adenine methylase
MRELYNQNKNPLDLFVLIAYSFNHQIRFNNNHEFNNPFGRERSNFNASMKQNLEWFIIRLKESNAVFSDTNFEDFDFSFLTPNDFVYCDPPYLITTGTYNDGKRGFTGWNENEEKQLLKTLDNLDNQSIKFALSNVLEHKGKSNNFIFIICLN